jgi:mono/diheme cytochrome c family protein
MALEKNNPISEMPKDAPAELPLPPLPRPPFWMVSVALISIVVTWLPLALIAKARVSRSVDPRIQLLQDMGVQPKMLAQMTNPLFADSREMRPKIEGTVARGQLYDDDNYEHGFVLSNDPSTRPAPVFVTDLSQEVPLTRKLLERGQNRFNIYCYVCHGYDGSGNGMVNQRAMEMQADGIPGMSWTQAIQLTSDKIRAESDGQIFNTVTNGIRTMPGYAGQIPVADRWAIVAYVRCLQFSQQAPLTAAPPDKQEALKAQ